MRTFSAVIAARDAASHVGEAIASIRAQPECVEIVVVDDASTDTTGDIARAEGADVVIRLDDNAGPAAARNRGVTASTGTVVGFCDADDVWTPGRLSAMAAALDDDVDLVVGRTRYEGLGHEEAQRYNFDGPDPVAMLPFLGSVIVRRRAFDLVGPFPTDMTNYEDWDWFLAASDLGATVATITEVVSVYRRRPDSLSQTSPPSATDRLRLLKRSVDRRRGSSRRSDRPRWGSA